MTSVSFNGVACENVGLEVLDTRRPLKARQRVEFVEIPGMDGSYAINDGAFEDMDIEVDFSLEQPAGMTFFAACRAVGAWLSTTDRAPLIFSDDPDYIYSAIVPDQVDLTERIAKFGQFTVVFKSKPREG